jgi:AraC family transcriptional regulator
MFVETGLRVMTYKSCAAMAPHTHDKPSFGIVVNGGFHERIGASERTYKRGHVGFCPAGMIHSQEFGTGGARQIIFKPKAEWLDYLADCKLKLSDAPYAGSQAIGHLADRLLDESRNADAFSVAAREGMLLEIIAYFGRGNAEIQREQNPPAWLRAARDFIHDNGLAPLNMATIAKAAGRHEIHLAREFRRYFGMPVGSYIRRLRIAHAARLLRVPDMTISEIALDCGFASHSHLCREFKVQYGITPSEFRTRN